MSEKNVFSKDTLVKYDNPIFITNHTIKSDRESCNQLKSKALSGSLPKIQSTSPATDSKQEIVDILHEILPPREWEEDGKKWIQKVSTNPATRLDVKNLQQELDIQLKKQVARETGLCPRRRKLYSQCFDEIIRQVTINCTERGLLLLRIRDELLMTVKAFETLYQSSIAFGLRKALLAASKTEKYITTIEELKAQIEELQKVTSHLEMKAQLTEKKAAESQEAIQKRHEEEVTFLKKINAQLKVQLEGIIAPKK